MKLFTQARPFVRADRVCALIQQTVSDILQKSIKDPRLELVTITGVKVSRDLRVARIYFSTSGGKKSRKDACKGFNSALGYIKRIVASQLSLRYMPDLKFYYDESVDYGAHIDRVLRSINEDRGADHTLE